jgi:cold-inducible RNA-binding protein
MTNIFIANLDWEITSEDLTVTFSSFGKVAYAHVVFDNKTKKSKGFGYVEMESADDAINAIQALNGMEINGRILDVKIASPKSNRPAKKPVDITQKRFQRPFTAKSNENSYKKPYDPNYKKRND